MYNTREQNKTTLLCFSMRSLLYGRTHRPEIKIARCTVQARVLKLRRRQKTWGGCGSAVLGKFRPSQQEAPITGSLTLLSNKIGKIPCLSTVLWTKVSLVVPESIICRPGHQIEDFLDALVLSIRLVQLFVTLHLRGGV